ncbi:FCPF [Symbiodinium sp. CCMP2592]|nr:FCPF [Symbiodinium sp. CCMP2592]
MAPSSQVAVAALAAAGCTAFVAAPSATRGPALRSTAQGQAKASSTSGTGLAICGLGAAVGAIAAPKKERVALRAFETELGVQPPAGFWDPLGFTKGGDAASFRRRRYVELKHGRVAMLACMGYIVPEYYRWPGELSPSLGIKFTDVPTGFAAFSKVPLSGWAQMVAFAGSVELFQYVDDPKRAPGDFQNAGLLGIPNGFMKAPEGQKEKKLAAEIANGRLAMMAIIGMFFQNGLTGQAWGDWSLYTDSPLRALTPAQEIIAGTGGPLPDNFWDPAGITNGKTEKEIAMLRAMELKHGRVAMLAVLHWFHVAAGYHLLGDYAIGERMSNDPLVSLTQLPMGGMWQVIFTIMCLEWLTTYICKPPEDRPWDVLGWKGIIDEDYPSEIWNGWKRVQCQELNNSRLAMVAITGLVAQDVVTGDYVAGLHQAKAKPQSPAGSVKAAAPAPKPRCGPAAFQLIKRIESQADSRLGSEADEEEDPEGSGFVGAGSDDDLRAGPQGSTSRFVMPGPEEDDMVPNQEDAAAAYVAQLKKSMGLQAPAESIFGVGEKFAVRFGGVLPQERVR